MQTEKTIKTTTEPELEPSVPGPDPVPEPDGANVPDPTRYGDWEKNGRCIDF